MKQHKKQLALLLVVVALAALGVLGACQRQRREVVLEFGMFTGSYWDVANADSFAIIDKAVELFEASHPNVKIHYYSGISKEDYSEWFSRKLLSNETPDVFMVLGSDFEQFASLGILKDLSPLMDEDPDFDSSRFFSSSFASGQYDGKQYALPYETVPTLMFVNQTLLNKEGIVVPDEDWTWDDLYEICRRVTRDVDGDGMLDQFGTYNYNWSDAIYSNNATLFEVDGSASHFADQRVVESVKFIHQLNDLNQGQTVTQEDFNAGKVAFMPLTFAEYRTYKTYPYKIKRYINFQWDCITMPAGYQGDNTSRVDTLVMGINSNTKHADLAWEFLKLLTYDEEMQMEIFRASQGASVLKSVTESLEAAQIVQSQMEEGDRVINGTLLAQVIEHGSIQPQFKKYTQAMTLANSEISNILNQDLAIDSRLKILQRTINTFLQQ